MIAMERPITADFTGALDLPQSHCPAPAIHVEGVRDGMAFAALREEWAALLEESHAGIFNAWEWLYPWYRRIGTDRQPYILTARDSDGKLLGILPLCLQETRALGRSVRRLSFMGETQVCGDFMDVVTRPEHHAEIVAAFAQHLDSARAEWDVLDLGDMDSRSATLPLLQEHWRHHGLAVETAETDTSPAMLFEPGASFDSFLKASGRKETYNRRRNWLQKQPGFEVEVVQDPARLALPLREFFRLHSLRWDNDGGEAITGPHVEAFHRDATALMAERGKLQLWVMRLEGKAVAAMYALRHGDSFYYYQAGRDPEWNNRSVGMVLLGYTIKSSIEAGLRSYEFLRGEEPYKEEWANSYKRLARLRVYDPAGPGKWLVRQEQLSRSARALASRLVPTTLKERARKALHR